MRRFVLPLALSALVMTGCGSTDSDVADPTQTSPPVEESTTAPAATPAPAVTATTAPTPTTDDTPSVEDMSVSEALALGFGQMSGEELAQFCDGLDLLGTDFLLDVLRAQPGGEEALQEMDPDEVTAAFEEQCANPAATDEPEVDSDPAAVGETQEVADYEITLDEFTPDATEAVMGMNDFNKEPENGAYATASFTVTYVGDSEGDPGFDLSYVVVSDGRQVADFDSECSTDASAYEMGTLENGGSASFTACYDVDPGAIERVFVEELLSFEDARVTWTP